MAKIEIYTKAFCGFCSRAKALTMSRTARCCSEKYKLSSIADGGFRAGKGRQLQVGPVPTRGTRPPLATHEGGFAFVRAVCRQTPDASHESLVHSLRSSQSAPLVHDANSRQSTGAVFGVAESYEQVSSAVIAAPKSAASIWQWISVSSG